MLSKSTTPRQVSVNAIGLPFGPVDESIVARPVPRRAPYVPVPAVIDQGPLAPAVCSTSPKKLALKVPEPSAQVKTRLPWPLPCHVPDGHSGDGAVKVPGDSRHPADGFRRDGRSRRLASR